MTMGKPPALVETLKYGLTDQGGGKVELLLKWVFRHITVPITVEVTAAEGGAGAGLLKCREHERTNRSLPFFLSCPPTIASVQPELRRSSRRMPVPRGGAAVTAKAPRTLAACWTALAISRCGGRASVRASRLTYGI